MSYTHLEGGWIRRDSDGAHIPPEPSNRDYAEYLEWVAAGGTAAPYVIPVPASVTRRQFKQALTRIGLRGAVESAIAAADQDTKDWYNDSLNFERANPLLNAMAAGLGKTPADIDNLFALADTL
jgi:hypothetical protein